MGESGLIWDLFYYHFIHLFTCGLPLQLRLTLNVGSSCFSPWNAGIVGMHYCMSPFLFTKMFRLGAAGMVQLLRELTVLSENPV